MGSRFGARAGLAAGITAARVDWIAPEPGKLNIGSLRCGPVWSFGACRPGLQVQGIGGFTDKRFAR